MLLTGLPGFLRGIPAPLLETRFLGVDKFQHFRFWMRRDLAMFLRDALIDSHAADLERGSTRRKWQGW